MRVLSWALGLGVVATLGLVGCGPPWDVVKQSGPPSALRGVGQIGVAFDDSELLVGRHRQTETEWLSDKSPERVRDYHEVWRAAEDTFIHAMNAELPVPVTRAGPQDEVTLVVRWGATVLGKYVGVYAEDTFLSAYLDFTVRGRLTDRITGWTVVEAGMARPSIRSRMDAAARRLALMGAEYVKRAQTR